MKKYSRSPVICHYGVKGMKWGVRRYQNADGTLTSEGRARYYNTDAVGNLTYTKEGVKEVKSYIKSMAKDEIDISKRSDLESLCKHIAAARKAKMDTLNDLVDESLAKIGKTRKQIDDKTLERIEVEAMNKAAETPAWKYSDQLEADLPNYIEKSVREIVGEDVFNQRVPELVYGVRGYRATTIGEEYVNSIFDVADTSIDEIYQYLWDNDIRPTIRETDD